MERRRVVVTGMGLVSPLGNQLETFWQRLVKGESGISAIEEYEESDLPVKIAGVIQDFDISSILSAKETRKLDLFIQYAVAASGAAIEHAALDLQQIDPTRVGCCIGSGIGGISTIETQVKTLLKGGPKRVSPFFITGSISNMASGMVSIQYGLKGPNYAMVTACSSGTHSIGIASRMIQYGDADVMVAGGAEKGSGPLGIASFAAARALSRRNDDPKAASRPWDKDRDGFVLSDGAGVVVLEEYEHAINRGAPILAEVIGFGSSSDAYHITAPCSDGAGAAQSMSSAIKDANLKPSDIDYINAHGTSTPLGDVAEVVAVKSVFGEAAEKVSISSTKSMIGHMLGAAGAVEAIITILAINNQLMPPTINLESPGEGCDLDFVPNEAREKRLVYAMSNSFGFGGTNGSLILGQCR